MAKKITYKFAGLSGNGNFIIEDSNGEPVCYVADINRGRQIIEALTAMQARGTK